MDRVVLRRSDHELSSSGPGRGLAAVSGQVGLVSGLAGKVSGRVRGRAPRGRARRCHASGRRPVSQFQLGRHDAEVAQLQLVVYAPLDRLPDVGGREERRGTRGMVRNQLDQLTGELAKPAIRLHDEREELSSLLLSPCEVLAVLSRLGAGSSAQGALRGQGQVSGRRGVDHRDVDVHQLAAQREADVGVLVVSVVQLEAGLREKEKKTKSLQW